LRFEIPYGGIVSPGARLRRRQMPGYVGDKDQIFARLVRA